MEVAVDLVLLFILSKVNSFFYKTSWKYILAVYLMGKTKVIGNSSLPNVIFFLNRNLNTQQVSTERKKSENSFQHAAGLYLTAIVMKIASTGLLLSI